MKKLQLKSIQVLPAGNVSAFDVNGFQIADLQDYLLTLWAEHAEQKGIDVDGVSVQFVGVKYQVIRNRSKDGFKWLIR